MQTSIPYQCARYGHLNRYKKETRTLYAKRLVGNTIVKWVQSLGPLCSNAMYIKERVLSVIDLQDAKEMGINRNACYMTMQHFPFFSGISSVGSGRRVVLTFSLGARLIDPGLGEGTRGP